MTNILKWAMIVATWVVMGVLLLFVLSILQGVVFFAKTALQTILYPVIYLFNLVTTGKK